MRRLDFFVTGTDTGVGKSLVAAALLTAIGKQGRRAVGMKPVAAGAEFSNGQWHNDDVDQLMAASNVHAAPECVCPYLLQEPVAPHIAAQRAQVSIELPHLQACFAALQALSDSVVVEGAGGWLVPLTRTQTMADFAQTLDVPIVLVVGLRLGCINHALLTAEAIRARGLRLAGWVANTIDPEMPELEANVQALQERLPAPLLAHIPCWSADQAHTRVSATADLFDTSAFI